MTCVQFTPFPAGPASAPCTPLSPRPSAVSQRSFTGGSVQGLAQNEARATSRTLGLYRPAIFFGHSDLKTFRPSDLTTVRPPSPAFSRSCRLLPLSLQRFHPSYPFYSTAYSLFFATTGGGGTTVPRANSQTAEEQPTADGSHYLCNEERTRRDSAKVPGRRRRRAGEAMPSRSRGPVFQVPAVTRRWSGVVQSRRKNRKACDKRIRKDRRQDRVQARRTTLQRARASKTLWCSAAYTALDRAGTSGDAGLRRS